MKGIQALAHEQLIIIINALEHDEFGCDDEFDLDLFYESLEEIQIDDTRPKNTISGT